MKYDYLAERAAYLSEKSKEKSPYLQDIEDLASGHYRDEEDTDAAILHYLARGVEKSKEDDIRLSDEVEQLKKQVVKNNNQMDAVVNKMKSMNTQPNTSNDELRQLKDRVSKIEKLCRTIQNTR